MDLDDWIKYFNGNLDLVNSVYYLQKRTAYTDNEIKEVIEKIKIVAQKINLSVCEVINLLVASETMELK